MGGSFANGDPAASAPPAVSRPAKPSQSSQKVFPLASTPVGAGESEPKTVRIRTDQLLAIVNGVHITMKDLVPIVKGMNDVEQTMTEDEFRVRLERAIERELTFQAAQGQGIQLTEAQQKRLQEIRAEHQAHLQKPGLQWSNLNDPIIEFDIRDNTARLLQASLMYLAGAPPFHVTDDQVQAYYKSHLNQFEPLPADAAERDAAWQKIDRTIRSELASENQKEYQNQVRKYLQQLKSAATITVNEPSS
jgi:hypothetical protein